MLVSRRPMDLRRRRTRFAGAFVAVLLSTVGTVVAQAPAVQADQAGLGGDYVPLATYARVLDTRNDTGGAKGQMGAGATKSFPVLGVGGVPSNGVSAVLARAITVAPSNGTWLSLWPDGTTRSEASTVLNAGAGETISNEAVVPVGSNGKLSVFNGAGNTDVIVDITGYFTSSSGGSGGGFFPVDHTRLVDTRSGIGTAKGTIPAYGTRTVKLTGGVVPNGANAVFLDVIVTGVTKGGYLVAYPAGGTDGPAVNFPGTPATTTHGLAVKLSSDGQATFRNQSPAAVNLVLTAEGYFSSSSTTGAGMRPVTTRLLDTRPTGTLAAGATVDVQVGGVSGLPTRGIAAASLDLTVTNQTKEGYLQAWPLGGTETTSSLTYFYANKAARSSIAVVKVGTEGKIRIKNNSAGTINLMVDLQGWFADPLPGVPVAQYSPMSVTQLKPLDAATLGAVEYSFADNLGFVHYGHQASPNSFDIQWSVISGYEAFTGPPVVSQLSDGRVQVTAQNGDSNIWSVSQTAVGSPAWNPWAKLGGSPAAPPVVGKLSDGTTVLFAVDADGRLWAYPQTGSKPSWISLGTASLTGRISLAQAKDGLRLVAVDTSGAVKTAVYRDDRTFSGWTSLGGSGLNGTPSVVLFPGPRAMIFVRSADGTIVSKVQDAAGNFSATWAPVGTFAAAGSPVAILDPVFLRTSVVARGTDNMLHTVWETGQGTGVWGNWDISDARLIATDPAITTLTSSGGQSWVAVSRDINNQIVLLLRSDPVSDAALASQRAGAAIGFATKVLPAPPDTE